MCRVKTIELVFENSECVTLDSEQFEWFHLSCTEQTVSGRGYSISKSLWTNNVNFTVKENIPEIKDSNVQDGIIGEWLEDHSLFGRLKYGDITQIHITYDDGEKEVYYVDDYDEAREFGPNKNQSYKEVDGMLEVTIGNA